MAHLAMLTVATQRSTGTMRVEHEFESVWKEVVAALFQVVSVCLQGQRGKHGNIPDRSAGRLEPKTSEYVGGILPTLSSTDATLSKHLSRLRHTLSRHTCRRRFGLACCLHLQGWNVLGSKSKSRSNWRSVSHCLGVEPHAGTYIENVSD
jgi:hypothetical protein